MKISLVTLVAMTDVARGSSSALKHIHEVLANVEERMLQFPGFPNDRGEIVKNFDDCVEALGGKRLFKCFMAQGVEDLAPPPRPRFGNRTEEITQEQCERFFNSTSSQCLAVLDPIDVETFSKTLLDERLQDEPKCELLTKLPTFPGPRPDRNSTDSSEECVNEVAGPNPRESGDFLKEIAEKCEEFSTGSTTDRIQSFLTDQEKENSAITFASGMLTVLFVSFLF